MKEYGTAIIGAGPAGLFCAIHAASPDSSVLLLESNPQPGAKLRITGSGQCNLTHAGEIRAFFSHYRSQANFLKPALLSFTNADLCRFFTDRGIAMETEATGKIFPASRRSADILEVLIRECTRQKVAIEYGAAVESVVHDSSGFIISTNQNQHRADRLVIATGGKSYPASGSRGDGYRFAAMLGHTITPTGPALTPIIIRDHPFADLSGISFSGIRFSIWREKKKVFAGSGDILITHNGLSGPGILDSSRDMRPGDTIVLSFLPGQAGTEIFSRDLSERISSHGKKLVKSVLIQYNIPERLIRRLLEISGVPDDLTCAHLSSTLRSRLVGSVTGLPLIISSLGDYSIAMVTRGGVALDEVNPKTMESRFVPGLYFAGEVLDIDGDTGGYNLQAAFSTGRCAGIAIRQQVHKP